MEMIWVLFLSHDIYTNDVILQSYKMIAVWLFFSFNSFYDDNFFILFISSKMELTRVR